MPQGYYLLTKVKMKPTPEDYEKTTGVYTIFRFKEGPTHAPSAGVGREIRDYCALAAGKAKDGRGTQFGFGMLLGALGSSKIAKKLPEQSIDSYGELVSLIEAIDERIGAVDVVALVADQTGQTGRPFSSIEEFYPAEEWSNLKGAQLGPVQRVVANGSTAVPAATPLAVEALKAKAKALFEE